MPGFPPRGGTLYVFSIDGESPHGGAGHATTEGQAAGGAPGPRHGRQAVNARALPILPASRRSPLAALAASVLTGCERAQRRQHGGAAGDRRDQHRGDRRGAARRSSPAPPRARSLTSIPNPYHDNPQAVQQGHDLFIQMNCAGCHGYGAKGGMGPNLTDGYWRYGGVPARSSSRSTRAARRACRPGTGACRRRRSGRSSPTSSRSAAPTRRRSTRRRSRATARRQRPARGAGDAAGAAGREAARARRAARRRRAERRPPQPDVGAAAGHRQ